MAQPITGADSKGYAAPKIAAFRIERAFCAGLVALAACSVPR